LYYSCKMKLGILTVQSRIIYISYYCHKIQPSKYISAPDTKPTVVYVLRIFYYNYERKAAHEGKITEKQRLGWIKGAIAFFNSIITDHQRRKNIQRWGTPLLFWKNVSRHIHLATCLRDNFKWF